MGRLTDLLDVACLTYSIERKGYRVTSDPFMYATGNYGETDFISGVVRVREGLSLWETSVVLRHEYAHVLGAALVHQNEDERKLARKYGAFQCGSYWASKAENKRTARYLRMALEKNGGNRWTFSKTLRVTLSSVRTSMVSWGPSLALRQRRRSRG